MAAPPFEPGNALLFDIYTDAAAAPQPPRPSSVPTALPAGPCGFVDLTPGANGARCGCRRFWARAPPTQPRAFPDAVAPDQAYWCMCSHHACYHEGIHAAPVTHVQTPFLAVSAPPERDPFTGQENERPRGNREPLSPVQDVLAAFKMPGLGLSMDVPGFNYVGPSSAADRSAGGGLAPPSAPGQYSTQAAVQTTAQTAESSLPDTLNWNNFRSPSQPCAAGLPPIPSQCLLSQAHSVSSSNQARYLRPFGGNGLNTLKGKGPAELEETSNAREREASPPVDGDATVPNTQGSPVCVQVVSAPTPRARWTQDSSPRPHSSIGFNQEAARSLKDIVQSHGQRLEKLENPSFSVIGHDECHEKHDQIDLRVTELESRVEEVEKRLADDNSTVVGGQRAPASILSDVTTTFSTSQVYSQLQQLQAQVNRLQSSSLPTYNSPWELEVVVLPYPLKGVWMSAHEFQSQRPSGVADTSAWDSVGDEWTQQPNTHSRQTPDPQSSFVTDWLAQSASPTWLLPRACAPGRMIDQRLRSRGFIKTISVKGSDARSVHLAVNAAFSGVLHALHVETSSHRSSPLANAMFEKFLGLSQPWVPLRKLHKDSRLRFLSPAEMLTPTLWDAAFLVSSVVMKATGMHRLFVTQPEAYVQDKLARESGCGWTWQRLRELPPACLDSQSSTDSTQEPSEHESFWQWNDRLDEPPTRNPASAIPRDSTTLSRSTAASPSQVFHTAGHSPTLARGLSPALIRERRGSRPPHLRTASVPLGTTPALSSPGGQSSRVRVASFTAVASKSSPYERRSSPLVSRLQTASAAKRRSGRGDDRSPSLRPRNTPRWSTASRSSSAMREVSAAPQEDQRMRGTTPFCYATPYSTAPADVPRSNGGRVVSGGSVPQGVHYDDEDMDYGDYWSISQYDEELVVHEDEDADGDINVYEDGGDEQDSKENSFVRVGGCSHDRQLPPEDEPWPGIEDTDNMSDGENMDPVSLPDDLPADDDDAATDVSSQPSEYPSTQHGWRGRGEGDAGGFRIHEDEDVQGNGRVFGVGGRW